MRYSVLNFFWPKPVVRLYNIRQELLARETTDPQQFSQDLRYWAGELASYNQYDEAWLLIGYFQNRGLCGQAAINSAIESIYIYSDYDKQVDLIEHHILVILALLWKNTRPLPHVEGIEKDAVLTAIVLQAFIGWLLFVPILGYVRDFLEDRDIVGKRLSTTLDVFKQDFISYFTAKLTGLFEEEGIATVDAAAERVRFEFQVKALGDNPPDFHRLLVNNPAAAAPSLEKAFGDQLVNVIPDANDPTKIQIMVKYRSAEKCEQLINQMDSPSFTLSELNEIARTHMVSTRRLGQRS